MIQNTVSYNFGLLNGRKIQTVQMANSVLIHIFGDLSTYGVGTLDNI